MILPPVAGRACSAQLARKWPGWGRARGRRRGAWWTYGGDCMPRFGVLVLVMCVGGVLVAGVLGSSAALATPGSQVEVPIRRWGEKGAWRVLRGWFSLEDLARTRRYGRAGGHICIGVSHYETRLFWLAVPGVNRFFRCLGTILPEWSRPGCRCARKGSLLPIKRATVSGSKGMRRWRSVPVRCCQPAAQSSLCRVGRAPVDATGKDVCGRIRVRLRRTSGLQSGDAAGRS